MSDQGGYGYPGNADWQLQPPYGPRPTNTLAVLALVFAFLFAPLGIVFGHIARNQIRKSGEDGDGLALAGLILGYIFTGLGVLAVTVWIAFFGLLTAALNESSSQSYPYTPQNSYSATATRPPTVPPRTTTPSATPSATATPRPTTAVGPAPTVSGTDRQGFRYDGPSCNANNPAVAVAVTTGSRVVICQTGVGRYYYKGERLSDGAVIELDDPVRTADGFTVTNKDVTYKLTSAGLSISANGTQLGNEPALEFWIN
ncbi:hypothetical protein ABH922_004575 [Rhodococcus sp. 27YEA15]|uniref:DUF4190 domain-containing protein n=1 Tax=Rhodococcus sp. 27YEA15 TaxID=3156259 RepID=UPI003C7A56C1